MHGVIETKRLRNEDSIETVTVTPAMAADLLEHNRLNRPLKDQHVKRIADQIASGKWRFNGDTIKISEGGDVLDGQHRLWAIIEAKKPVETLIVRGIKREAFATIDTLRSPRSGGDVIALNGATLYRNTIATSIQWLIRWRKGVIENFRSPENRIENSDIEDFYQNNPSIVQAVGRASQLRGIANPSILAFFYYVLSTRNSELAERMMETLRDPAAVSISDPFFRLRSYFTSDKGGRHKDPIVTIALMVKAANFAFAGKRVDALTWKNQGERREPFPTLKVS